MSLRTKLESQLINLRSFRSFFPLLRTVGDMLMLPAQMARKGGRSNTFPFVININITTRCNLHCPYCFNAENKVARADELTLDEYRRLAAQWAPYRPGVFLSGGEPFAREDVIEIVEAFKRFGLPVGLVSNGTLMTADQARRLADLGLNALLISIHGGRETHDRTVGMTGAYDRSLAALRTWTEMKKRPGPMVNYVLSEKSVSDLAQFVDDVADLPRVVVRLSHLNFLTADEIAKQRDFWRGRFNDVPIDILTHQYEPQEGAFAPLIEFLHSDRARGVLTKPVLDDHEIRQWYSKTAALSRRCVFIWRSTFLNAQGDVYPCQFLYVRMGNLRQDRMEAIWNNELYRRFRSTLRQGLMPGCARCCKI